MMQKLEYYGSDKARIDLHEKTKSNKNKSTTSNDLYSKIEYKQKKSKAKRGETFVGNDDKFGMTSS